MFMIEFIALALLPTLAGWLLGRWKPGRVSATAVWATTVAAVVFVALGSASGNQIAFALSYAFAGATAGLLGARLFRHSLLVSLVMTAIFGVALLGGVFMFGVTFGCAWSGQCL